MHFFNASASFISLIWQVNHRIRYNGFWAFSFSQTFYCTKNNEITSKFLKLEDGRMCCYLSHGSLLEEDASLIAICPGWTLIWVFLVGLFLKGWYTKYLLAANSNIFCSAVRLYSAIFVYFDLIYDVQEQVSFRPDNLHTFSIKVTYFSKLHSFKKHIILDKIVLHIFFPMQFITQYTLVIYHFMVFC